MGPLASCMRILGEGPNGGHENACARGKKWIHDHGGVTHIPSWGKTWLSVSHSIQNKDIHPFSQKDKSVSLPCHQSQVKLFKML